MKNVFTDSSLCIFIFYLTYSFSLSFFIGCGDTSDESQKSISTPEEASLLKKWYEIEDPDLYTERFRAQLIKQFGNIPEVHILADLEGKKRKWVPLTLDEYIAYHEAHYHLWGNKNTLRILEEAREMKAKGIKFYMLYMDAPKEVMIIQLEAMLGRKPKKHEVEEYMALARRDFDFLRAAGWTKHDEDEDEDEDDDD